MLHVASFRHMNIKLTVCFRMRMGRVPCTRSNSVFFTFCVLLCKTKQNVVLFFPNRTFLKRTFRSRSAAGKPRDIFHKICVWTLHVHSLRGAGWRSSAINLLAARRCSSKWCLRAACMPPLLFEETSKLDLTAAVRLNQVQPTADYVGFLAGILASIYKPDTTF